MVAMMPVVTDITENPFTKIGLCLDAFGLVKVDIVLFFIYFLLKEADALLRDTVEAARWV